MAIRSQQSADTGSVLDGATAIVAHEDESAVRTLSAWLASRLTTVVSSAAADDVVALVSATGPDLVIVGPRLGAVDGLEVVARLKQSPATATVPVIHVSVRPEGDRTISELVHAGADAFLVEPLDRDVFLANAELLIRQRDLARQLEVALSTGDSGVYDWSVRNGSVRWSTSLEQVFGLVPGTFPGTIDAFVEAAHPDDRDSLADRLEQIVHRPGDRFDFSFRFLHDDGSVGHIESRGRLFRDLEGQPARVLGFAHDVSRRVADRAQIEQLRRLGSRLGALRTSGAVLEALRDELDGTNVGVELVDAGEETAAAVYTYPLNEQVVVVSWTPSPGGISRRQAIAIGDLAGPAIDRALRFEAEELNARMLQRALSPSMRLDVPGYSVRAVYEPATSDDRLGGDFVDLLDLGSCFVVTVGDVAGHGLDATRQMATVRTLLRTLAADTRGAPLNMIERARSLFADVCGPDASIVTALVASVDTATGRVTFATAGHPPPIVGGRSCVTSLLPIRSRPVLGMPDDTPGEVHIHQLHPGDWLALYTDGVFESRTVVLPDAIDGALARLESGVPTPSSIMEAGAGVSDATTDDRAVVVIVRS